MIKKRRKDDWKFWKIGWQYKSDAPHNRQWKKDRKALFSKNGNGWWWFPQEKRSKSSRIHKELRFPYWIEIPLTEDGTEFTSCKIKDRKEEKILKNTNTEFFNE